MRDFILLCLLVSMSSSISAQQVEFFGGINSNHLYDSNSKDAFPYSSSLSSGKDFTFGFSFDNPNMNGYASRITLSYSRITGSVSTGFVDPDLSDSGSFTSANIEKNTINLALYPFTFIIQNIYMSFGVQGNFMLSNNTTGEYGYINLGGQQPLGPTASATEPTFHKDIGYGLAMRIHYNIMLNNGISIIPQYNLYYGIGEEYSTAESEKIKVWQQLLAIGIGMQF